MQETKETWNQSPGREDYLEEGMALHTSILPGESVTHQGPLSSQVHKESDRTAASQHSSAKSTEQPLNKEWERLEVSSREPDAKGTFHAKRSTIKDRNGMGLTEAEEIRKRWQEFTELYKKDLHDPDNYNGVITTMV